VEDFPPVSAVRDSHAIVVPRNRSEIEDHGNNFAGVLRLAHEAEYALLRVAAIDPVEACRVAVQFVERPFISIRAVQVRHPSLQAAMRFMLKQVPLETALVRPLGPLTELAAH